MKENTTIIKENELYKKIGKNIKYYRRLYSINIEEMTQEKLAKKINASTSLIGNLESSKIVQGISLYNLYKISIVLKVKIDKFFE
ncbi:MAG: helix-turn-helix transcriptional regulator [Bacilli bacterium]|nr:helix-turn-helix transcriptional regulator [Bacilli bacterium]